MIDGSIIKKNVREKQIGGRCLMAEFPFEIQTETDVPLWVQLRKRLIHLINTGYYRAGDQLPTVRGLATELAINYNTVNKAYLSMINDGYIASTRGRGVFVCELEVSLGDDSLREAAALINDCVDACLELGLAANEIRQLMTRRLQANEQENGQEQAQGIGQGQVESQGQGSAQGKEPTNERGQGQRIGQGQGINPSSKTTEADKPLRVLEGSGGKSKKQKSS